VPGEEATGGMVRNHFILDWYHGNEYEANDTPRGFGPGEILRFRLIVVDVCDGGKTIFTSKTISVNF
jgi:hypothetical protein